MFYDYFKHVFPDLNSVWLTFTRIPQFNLYILGLNYKLLIKQICLQFLIKQLSLKTHQ